MLTPGDLPGFDYQPASPPAGPAQDGSQPAKLPGPKAKQAEALFQSVDYMTRGFLMPATACAAGFPATGDPEAVKHVGFLTLTIGDYVEIEPDETEAPEEIEEDDETGKRYRFIKVTDRREAERRFNSLLTNVISKKYRCGVTVRERHKDGGIHYHLIVWTAGDIRSGADGSPTLNFEECFSKEPQFRKLGKARYRSANDTIKAEWKFWREHSANYGFYRHRLEPVRINGEALARYCAKYVTKGWFERHPDDKHAKVIRYFGDWKRKIDTEYKEPEKQARHRRKLILRPDQHPENCQICRKLVARELKTRWENSPLGILRRKYRDYEHPKPCRDCIFALGIIQNRILRKTKPPVSARFSWAGDKKPFATAWRLALGQMRIITKYQGEEINPRNIRQKMGKSWALNFTRKIKSLLLVPEDTMPEKIREVIDKHNAEVTDNFTVYLPPASNSPGQFRAIYRNIVETTPADWTIEKTTGEADLEQLQARRDNYYRSREFDEVIEDFPKN